MSEQRPDPRALLATLEDEARGRLKVFLGAAPGVGKTFAMLQAAQDAASRGVDVVIGVLETHGRRDTAQMAEGLEVSPRAFVDWRGVQVATFDLDAALARRPGLLLVDELAASNPPGARHPQRWGDVEELVAAGLHVYTTLNIQHVESLNDHVAQVTGVRVRETVPDHVLDGADEVELIDVEPERLLERLREGKIYEAQTAQRAMAHFFRRGNLIALRELALRRASARASSRAEAWRQAHGAARGWSAAARLLVCVGPSPFSGRVIRTAASMAQRLDARWEVAWVESAALAEDHAARERVLAHLRLAERLGAQTHILHGEDAAAALLDFTRRHNITMLVIGKPGRASLRDRLGGGLVDRLIRDSGELEVHVVRGADEGGGEGRAAPARGRVAWAEWGGAALVVALCVGFGLMIRGAAAEADVAMTLLLGVVVVSRWASFWAALGAVLMSVAAFNFFFVHPYYTFAVAEAKYLWTFVVMAIVGSLMSATALRLREQARAALRREQLTAALYAFSRELAEAVEVEALAQRAIAHLAQAFGASGALWWREGAGELELVAAWPDAAAFEAQAEQSCARWCADHGQEVGAGTGTLAGVSGRYVPLGGRGVLGLVSAQAGQLDDPEQRHLLHSFADQLGVALERLGLRQQAEQARLAAQAEQVRSGLLSSVSHDLRTPLAAIMGGASALLDPQVQLDAGSRREMLEGIRDESERLARLLQNLLEMTRLEGGGAPRLQWQPPEEVILSSVERVGGARVKVRLEVGDALLCIDEQLVEIALVNLLENAMKYGPPGAAVEVMAQRRGDLVWIEVLDRGPGLPQGVAPAVLFEKFWRGSATSSVRGTGLGLAICKAVMDVHGGQVLAQDREGGGARFGLGFVVGEPPEDAEV